MKRITLILIIVIVIFGLILAYKIINNSPAAQIYDATGETKNYLEEAQEDISQKALESSKKSEEILKQIMSK